MDEFYKAVLLGIVEGITEFLPISSTGHLILFNEFIGFTGYFAHMFDVVIQLGAILSVAIYFRHKLFPFRKANTDHRRRVFTLWKKTIVGVLPALLIGSIFGNYIEEKLFNPLTVSVSLLIGGFILILVENRKKQSRIQDIDALDYKTVLLIGLIQCLAMIPGTSRSAATIIGAMMLGTSRLLAAEYSFFLAIPTMSAATFYSLVKIGFTLTLSEFYILITGFIVSFIVALMVIAGFMRYISRRSFKPFGYYRIILGVFVLTYFYFQ